ncbi:MAG: glycosyltransferase WbuB, partial [Acidobacteria bacterium]
MKGRLGYLSGAPRVSTIPQTELTGPRTHVLGVIHAFEQLGWDVKKFIVGDRVPKSWVTSGSEQFIAQSRSRALTADLLRLPMQSNFAREAWHALGNEVDWVYERFGVFQKMGSIFKKHRKLWILETNGPAFIEAND